MSKVGDIVATAYGHRETRVIDLVQARRFHIVPAAFPPERAIFYALATTALNDYLSSEVCPDNSSRAWTAMGLRPNVADGLWALDVGQAGD